MPTSISVVRTPEAEIGHEAPVSVDEPELLPVAAPPSPHGTTGGAIPESAEPLLEPLPLLDPLLLPELPPLDAPPELLPPELLPLPEPLLPELPAPEPPVPDPPLLVPAAPELPPSGPPSLPQSMGVLALPHAAASKTDASETAPVARTRLCSADPEILLSRFMILTKPQGDEGEQLWLSIDGARSARASETAGAANIK
jgi:hypothetical protein